MSQPDLFTAEAPTAFTLPTVKYGPIRTPTGRIECLLRGPIVVEATKIGEVAVSPRVKEPIYRTADGETFILTTRTKVARPPAADGVLLSGADGSLSWTSHRLVDDLEAQAAAEGWPAVVTARARLWEGQVAFRAEAPNDDGTVDEDRRGLRPPQLGALHAIGAHWSLHRQAATVVMPTGTGKTETMLAALAAYMRKPMLVVVPGDALRAQTIGKFINMGLLRWLKVLPEDAPNPIVGIITKVPKTPDALEVFERCNVIVTTMTSVADAGAEPLWPEIVKRVGALVIDEAHHVSAARWSSFREAFADRPILQFTATPFRRDGQLVDGQVIYSYSLRRAQQDGYFRRITFDPVYEPTPSKADKAIAEAAVAKLREDIAAGLDHRMMARCASIDRANKIHALYGRLAPELKPTIIHSDQTDARQRVADLIAGRNHIVVCVNMLGEGFDLPQLKVAAVHDLHKSLAILLQFTGRFTRSSAENIGNATIIANIAEPNVSAALERLYSEDADWNDVLSELSSQAAQEHARLVAFLNEAQRLDKGVQNEDTPISHKLLKPPLSTLFYEAKSFQPKNFHQGLPESFVPYRVWLHSPSNTLFLVTRSEPSVKWSRSKAVRDRTWTLFVLHYDATRSILYLASTDKDSNFAPLAKAVGATTLISGDVIFRALGRINRLIFQNLGVKKHGRRNLSYASYTGAEVVGALSQAEKSGSIKALLSGIGWEHGRQTTVGCTVKGRVWSRDQGGSLPRFIEWAQGVGDKLRDASIDSSKLIDNVLLPTVVTALPTAELLGVDWPVELLRQSEERVVFSDGTSKAAQTTFELTIAGMDRSTNAIEFDLVEATTGLWARFRFELSGPDGYTVTQISGSTVHVTSGKLHQPLSDYFGDYPPLFRFVDLSELDANLHIVPQTPYDLTIGEDRFECWDWTGVDITKESMWKDGAERADSIQAHVAKHYIDAGFDIVFDDDASGEAADLVCIKAEKDHLRLALVHCKFSGGTTVGERVKDVVEVASQAVRSARWLGRFQHLAQHLKVRNEALKAPSRPSRYLKGGPGELNQLVKFHRFHPIRAEIVMVQPGLSKSKRTSSQDTVLGAALTYLKETVGLDLAIVCSE
ncbi:DEAD/DEAH box helicase [Caulobacter sp. NIBR2454]|uniref:DEAD/DEAH box helicase n=1 Tax=Caulobacter sp. NIBR2454 TaxID=3015996 RepID=UPI0022B61B52|nr:DEAD/DEAH box helicase family protein [Caulobacter sp. NIBR2454]